MPENLEWATPSENNKHARETGLARLGTSQAIQCKIIETGEIFSSKTKAAVEIGRYFDYFERCKKRGLPIIDGRSNTEIHVEYIYPKEDKVNESKE